METWQANLRSRVRALGYTDLSEYLRARAGVPYPGLAEELGSGIVGVQIADEQLRDAATKGKDALLRAAQDSLVRCLRQVLTNGWSRTPGDGDVSPEFVNITAWTTWGSLVRSHVPDGLADAVLDRLNSCARAGWLPASPDDDTIAAVFQDWK